MGAEATMRASHRARQTRPVELSTTQLAKAIAPKLMLSHLMHDLDGKPGCARPASRIGRINKTDHRRSVFTNRCETIAQPSRAGLKVIEIERMGNLFGTGEAWPSRIWTRQRRRLLGVAIAFRWNRKRNLLQCGQFR
jgi:hypothetical protein